MIGNVAEQTAEIELSRVGLGDSTFRGRGKPAAGNDHAVKSVRSSPGNKTGLRIYCAYDTASAEIDRDCLARIVSARVEDDHVSPQCVVKIGRASCRERV